MVRYTTVQVYGNNTSNICHVPYPKQVPSGKNNKYSSSDNNNNNNNNN